MNYEVSLEDDNSKDNSKETKNEEINDKDLQVENLKADETHPVNGLESKQDNLEIKTVNDETNSDDNLNEEEMKNLTSSIDLLIKAASFQNPRQFQLPLEYQPAYSQFPGTSRRPYSNLFSGQLSVNNKSVKKQIYEADNGLTATPFKLCFKCEKSCRRSCLLQCDYCPLLYHLGM